MKKTLLGLAVLGLLSSGAWADNVDSIALDIQVDAINELEIDGATAVLTVNAATAGAEPTAATASTTYDITTNAALNAKKVTGVLTSALPTGLTLTVTPQVPGGAVIGGDLTYSGAVVSRDLLTGIEAVVLSNGTLGFSLQANVASGVIANGASDNTLTLTLGDS